MSMFNQLLVLSAGSGAGLMLFILVLSACGVEAVKAVTVRSTVSNFVVGAVFGVFIVASMLLLNETRLALLNLIAAGFCAALLGWCFAMIGEDRRKALPTFQNRIHYAGLTASCGAVAGLSMYITTWLFSLPIMGGLISL